MGRNQHLPDGRLLGMAWLIELCASDNLLAALPDGIARLTRLRELLLRNNKLALLPEWTVNSKVVRAPFVTDPFLRYPLFSDTIRSCG
jgi:hypothetical protein